MAELPYDIILHKILTRLPLKDVARCRILNKYFYTALSTPKFMRDHLALLSSSSSNPIVFHNTSTKFTTISSPVRKSITLADEDAVLVDSCNGILLLHSRRSENYYIFNPFTGGVMFFNYYDPKRPLTGTLVVHNINPSSASSASSSPSNLFDFKLVESLVAKKRGVHTRMRFRMFVPSGQRELVMREVNWEHEGWFAPIVDKNLRPVYGHGCVHWLGVGATAIAAFDVESGRARVMDGPVREAIEDCSHYRIWLGFARGSLQFIRKDYRNREPISVHTHNYVTQEWRVAHRIRMPDISGEAWLLLPMFFDGLKDVFFYKKEIDSDVEEIYVHDLSVGKWNTRGKVDYDFDQRYVGFFPTTARVSDCYLSNMLVQRRSTRTGLCLLALQRLLLDSF